MPFRNENWVAMVRVAAEGGDGGDVPPVALNRLVITAASLIDDMEDKEQIMDRCAFQRSSTWGAEIPNPDVISLP